MANPSSSVPTCGLLVDPAAVSLHDQLQAALAGAGDGALTALADQVPCDRRDAALTLALVHDLHVAPADEVGTAARFQHHPAVAALKGRLETAYLDRLRVEDPVFGDLPEDPVEAVRAIARRDLVPPIYDWAATRAGRRELVDFLALEGGPDGGFDDLVAICQVGLEGAPKLELATNYWDEMGTGDPDRVHTELYRRFVRAVELPRVPRADQPVEAVERSLLGSVLATNRILQPEMVGALGLIELQAGPRCRRVLAGLRRVGLTGGALDFYDEHAVADPRHGKDWLDRVVAPLADASRWAEGIVRGARWRWLVNARFFAALDGASPRPDRPGTV